MKYRYISTGYVLDAVFFLKGITWHFVDPQVLALRIWIRMNNFRQNERAYSVILLWNNYLQIFFLVLRDYMYNLPENLILKDFNIQSVTMTIRKFRMTRLI